MNLKSFAHQRTSPKLKRNLLSGRRCLHFYAGFFFSFCYWLVWSLFIFWHINPLWVTFFPKYTNNPYNSITQKEKKRGKRPKWKWTEDLNRHFFKEDIHMANRHMKKYSKSPIIRKMQIKTTMRYHLSLVRMTILKKSANNKCWRGCKIKKEPSYTFGGNVNWCIHYGKQCGDSSKN